MKLRHKLFVIPMAVGLVVAGTGRVMAGPVTTGLTLWLEADKGLASDGSTWADQSGLGNNAAALPAGNPTVVPGVFNGLPAVEFNGQAMSFAAPVITTQQFTIVVLVVDKTNKHSFPGDFLELGWDQFGYIGVPRNYLYQADKGTLHRCHRRARSGANGCRHDRKSTKWICPDGSEQRY
jgi:hypothetical protein